MALGVTVLGAGHPLVAHLVGTRAVEPTGCLFGFRLGGIHRRHSPLGSVLRSGDNGPAGSGDGEQDQSLHGLSEVVATLWALHRVSNYVV